MSRRDRAMPADVSPRCSSSANRQDGQDQQGGKGEESLHQVAATDLEHGEAVIPQCMKADRQEQVVRQQKDACKGKSARKPAGLPREDLLHRMTTRKIKWQV